MSHVAEKKGLQKMVERLVKKTHFKRQEVEQLQKVYTSRFGTNIKLDRQTFKSFVNVTLGITDDTIMDGVFNVFDANSDSHVCMEEWIKGLSLLLRGTSDEHTDFAFKVYDMNSDGFIGRDDMFTILNKALVRQMLEEDQEEGMRDLVDFCLKRLDIDHDQRVSLDDFRKAVTNDGLHQEILGQFIPCREYIEEFEDMVFRPKEEPRNWLATY